MAYDDYNPEYDQETGALKNSEQYVQMLPGINNQASSDLNATGGYNINPSYEDESQYRTYGNDGIQEAGDARYSSDFSYEDETVSGMLSSTQVASTPAAQQTLGPNQYRTQSGDVYTVINPQYLSGGASNNFSWASKYPGSGTSAVSGKSSTLGSAGIATTARQPYATATVRKTINQGATPTYNAPVWNESEIKKLRRKAAAPAIRALERQVRQVANQYYENPNVKAMVLSKTLAGYGIGLGGAIQGAEKAAQQEYGAQYARERENALMAYNVAMQQFQQSQTAITSTVPIYTKEGLQTFLDTGTVPT